MSPGSGLGVAGGQKLERGDLRCHPIDCALSELYLCVAETVHTSIFCSSIRIVFDYLGFRPSASALQVFGIAVFLFSFHQ